MENWPLTVQARKQLCTKYKVKESLEKLFIAGFSPNEIKKNGSHISEGLREEMKIVAWFPFHRQKKITLKSNSSSFSAKTEVRITSTKICTAHVTLHPLST